MQSDKMIPAMCSAVPQEAHLEAHRMQQCARLLQGLAGRCMSCCILSSRPAKRASCMHIVIWRCKTAWEEHAAAGEAMCMLTRRTLYLESIAAD